MKHLVGDLDGNCYSEHLGHADVLVDGRKIQNDDVQKSG